MDRLDAMRAFARIVERRSFARAAEDLGLPRSSVTDAVRALEARLGAQLLRRTTRRVEPTPDGEAYYRRCLRLIADLEEAEGLFRGGEPAGPLHLSVHGTLASHLVVPHLPGFLADHPGIALTLGEGDRYADLLREGIDAAIRVGNLGDGGEGGGDLIARRLATLEEATCASPAYLASHGPLRDPDDLGRGGHRMVGFRSSATGALLPLEFVTGQTGEVRRVVLPTSLVVGGAETYAAAARAGLGLIQSPRYRLEADFRGGALVPLLAATPPPPTPVSVVYPRARHPSPRLRAFVDWLAPRLRDPAAGSIRSGT